MAHRAQGKTSKDAWRKRYYEDNHTTRVDDQILYQMQMCTKELELYVKSNPSPILVRIAREWTQLLAAANGEVVDFNLKKERLPEDANGIFSHAVMTPPAPSK